MCPSSAKVKKSRKLHPKVADYAWLAALTFRLLLMVGFIDDLTLLLFSSVSQYSLGVTFQNANSAVSVKIVKLGKHI